MGSPAQGPEQDAGRWDEPRVPGFRLLRELGRGGAGQVWLARPVGRDHGLPSRVAIKLLGAWRDDDPAQLRRLSREGVIGQRLAHPHIVPVLSVIRVDGRSALVMPFIEGRHLDQWAPVPNGAPQASGRALLDARLGCLALVARALHHAHRQGVVHRDVKPSNVLVQADGHPWLIDFGLARDERASFTLTSTQAVLGTPLYLAPEVLSGKAHQADARSDVYSLGVVAHQLAAGRPPFTGSTREQLFRSILNDEPPRLQALEQDLPAGLEALVLATLEKQPGRRPASAQVFAQQLEALLAGHPAGGVSTPLVRRHGRQLLRRRAALLGLAVLLLASVALWLFQGRAASQAELQLQTMLTSGDRALANGDLSRALAAYDEAGSEHPRDPRPFQRRALAYAGFDLFDRAASELEQARLAGWRPGSQPSGADAFFAGLLTAARRDTSAGLAQMRAALETAPELDGALGVVFALQSNLGREAQAKASLQAWAADLKSRDPRSALVSALQLESEGRFEQAARLLAEDHGPSSDDSFWHHRHLGRLWLEAGRLDEAREELQRAVELVPLDAVSRCNLGLVAWWEGDPKRAEQLAREALDNSPGLAAATTLLAQCALDRGDWGRVVQLGNDVTGQGPASRALRQLRAEARVRQAGDRESRGDVAGAARAYEQALRAQPDRLDALSALASIHWLAGDLPSARGVFAQARDAWLAHPDPPGPDDAPWESVFGNPDDLVDLLVGLFATSAGCRDEQGAREALAQLDERLHGRAPAHPGSTLNLAEALATAPVAGLRDPERALRLLDDPTLVSACASRDDMAQLSRQVRAACASSN